MRVAFLGLGIMGHAMATNLVKAGHEVTVWNRTPGKLVEGAGIAPTPAAAVQGAEVAWLCVSDTDAVESVLFGADGAEASLTEGMIIADSSTISPSATLKFAERVASKGVAWVDAPMTGSKIGAQNGTLVFIVGGDEGQIERLKPLFAAMGKKIFRMGDTSKGQATKLAMNLQIALIFEGFAEALTLATKLGVDSQQLVRLIDATMVKSGVVEYVDAAGEMGGCAGEGESRVGSVRDEEECNHRCDLDRWFYLPPGRLFWSVTTEHNAAGLAEEVPSGLLERPIPRLQEGAILCRLR